MRRGTAQRGFSLLELLVAVAVFTVALLFSLRALSSVLHTSALQAQRTTEIANVDRLMDRWRAEEDLAWAIFTPPLDVQGQSNADHHEVDFFARDNSERDLFWAYQYDSTAQTLTRWTYAQPGGAPSLDETYEGVVRFTAQTYPITALQDASTPVYSALYAGAALHPGAVHFFASTAPWIAGGNQLTYLQIATTTQVRELQLSTLTAPTGYVVVFTYTPKPTPSPTPAAGALQTDPAYIYFTQSSVPVAMLSPAQQRARTMGQIVAMLTGGAKVLAAGPCLAYAYNGDPNSGGTIDANDGKIGSGSDGCMDGGDSTGSNGANVYVSQSGNSGGFNEQMDNCNGYVQPGYWDPKNASPGNLPIGLNSPPANYTCTFALTGDPGATPSPAPAFFTGLVGVVAPTPIPLVAHGGVMQGCNDAVAPCWFTTDGTLYGSSDGGHTWTSWIGTWTGECHPAEGKQAGDCREIPPSTVQWYCFADATPWIDRGNGGGTDWGCGNDVDMLGIYDAGGNSGTYPFPTYP